MVKDGSRGDSAWLGSGTLEIQLSAEAVIYLHAVQREIALVGIRFREAGRSPLRLVKVFLCSPDHTGSYLLPDRPR